MVSAATVCGMVKRITGAGVNRLAARRAAGVAALRQARQAAHEQAVTEAVAVYFDRSGQAALVRGEAKQRAERIMADAERTAAELDGSADAAVATLKTLGEPVREIAAMLDLPVTGVRAALARVNGGDTVVDEAVPTASLESDPVPRTSEAVVAAEAAAGT